jgi:hypothetical protein
MGADVFAGAGGGVRGAGATGAPLGGAGRDACGGGAGATGREVVGWVVCLGFGGAGGSG